MVHEVARRLGLVEVARRLGLGEVAPEHSLPRLGPVEVPTDQPLPALEPAQRVSLAEKLRHLITTLTRARRLGIPKGLPLWVALGVGLLLGGSAGVGLWNLYLGYLDVLKMEHQKTRVVRQEKPVRPTETVEDRYYGLNSEGQSLREDEYKLAERKIQTLAATVGVSGGVVVAVGVAMLLAWLPWYRWRLLTGAGVGLIVGGALGTGVALLHHGLCSPYTAGDVHYDSRNVKQSDAEYALDARKTTTTTFLIGASALVPCLLAGAALGQFWAWRQARRVRESLPRLLTELADTFPRVIEAWGGREALSRLESARSLLEAVERVPA